MAKYDNDVKQLLELVGGKENINTVAHCATRMRFVLNDNAKANADAIGKLDVVKGTFINAGQFQVIIGNDVPTFYREFIANAGITEATKADVKQAGVANQNKLQQAVAVLADIFVPLIPALVAGGFLLGFGNLLKATGLPWMPEGISYATDPNTADLVSQMLIYTEWIGGAVFGFLPVGVAWSTVRKFGGTPILGIVLGLLLVSPNFVNAYGYAINDGYTDGGELTVLVGPEAVATAIKKVSEDNENKKLVEKAKSGDETAKKELVDAENKEISAAYETAKTELNGKPGKYQLDFFGYKINLVGYQALVLPALFAGIILVWIEKFLNKFTPDVVKLVIVPLFTLLITGTLAIAIVGPLARELGNLIALFFTTVLEIPVLNIFGALIFGVGYAPLVITGLHHTFLAVDLQLIASTGSTPIWPMIAMSNVAQGVAAFAVFFIARKQNDVKLSEVSISGAVSAGFGITEPAMFGANLKLSYPFLAAITASGVGAVILTLGQVDAAAVGVGGLFLAWAAIIPSDWLVFFIATAATCTIAFGGTLLLAKTGLPSFKKEKQ